MRRRGALAAVVAVALLASASSAPAQEAATDTLWVAVGQLGLWAVDGPRLGQRAGIFKKRGLALHIFGTSGGGETLRAVISGSADLNVPVELAAMTRDKFQTKNAMRNDRLSDLDAVMVDAVQLKFLDRPLGKEQLAELIQIPSLQ